MRLTGRQRAFLDRPLRAILATHRRDGTAVQAVVWEGDAIWIGAAPDSVTARYPRGDPRVSTVALAEDGRGYFAIEGTATVIEDAGSPQRLDLMRRYLGEEGARRMIAARPPSRPNARVRVCPTRVTEYNLPE